MRQQIEATMQQALALLQSHFELRWTLANMLGWSLGLLLGSLSAALLGDLRIGALLIGGGVTGATVGLAQWLALREPLGEHFPVLRDRRRWLLLSSLGGMIGAVPVMLVSFAFLAGSATGFAIMGAVYGGSVGALQSLSLLDELPEFPLLWIPLNVFGGCLCGLLGLGITPFSLPVICTLGPPAFGLVTSIAWRLILQSELGEN